MIKDVQTEEGIIFAIGEKPPNWEILEKAFGVKWGNICVTYGNHIYSSKIISPNVVEHEKVHIKQQGNNPDKWWDKYIKDSKFRLEQEKEAYREQVKYIKCNSKDRNLIHKVCVSLVNDLSGKMYGECISFSDAYNCLIKN